MSRIAVTITTPDGLCSATLHTPLSAGPAVILYTDAAGVRETFAAMADRLSALGYVVLLPDGYYRTPYAPFDVATVFTVPAERERLTALGRSVPAELAVRDTGAYLDFLAGRAEVAGSAVGAVGYCLGGRFSLWAAAHFPRVAAAASFHGGNLAAADDPDSPHLVAGRIRGALHVAAARNDKAFPAEQHERLRNALVAAGVRHTLETYPAEHGFAVPDNATYDQSAEERHWTALKQLFAENLPRA
ncbi:dienelactone hydrolase family protein [Amycolatopsis sp. FDAARGOS 1241]|uniref:dienelactone hydrolase family protein n=1 Tax=Amycolatopsis sp. FDAARGOS 1241 TaxID=2778070 RepID=UPI001951569A|nr:dienelactone hydrolase family protein [Amycolatopsis sp. FDAARGOS 1241]QRP46865.1 dienelactone hydrolase family protein [Amycolatopsis sp. FDAARGOS 1241]